MGQMTMEGEFWPKAWPNLVDDLQKIEGARIKEKSVNENNLLTVTLEWYITEIFQHDY